MLRFLGIEKKIHLKARDMVDGQLALVDFNYDFGQLHADATHIRLLEGEALSDLLPMANWVGRLKIRVTALEHRKR